VSDSPAETPAPGATPPGRARRVAGWILGATVAVAALAFVASRLPRLSLSQVTDTIEQTPASTIALALGFVVGNYALLSLYDIIGLRYLRRSVPYPLVAFISFCSFAFGNVLGSNVVVGGALRYRLYARFGISPADRLRLVGFITTTAGAGVALVGGIAALTEPDVLARAADTTVGVVRATGLASLALLGVYTLFAWRGRPLPGPLGRLAELPSGPTAVAQTFVAAAEWSSIVAVLYVLLPPDGRPGFFGLLVMFVVAYFVGLLSYVPGGFGVMELTLSVLLAPWLDQAKVIGAMLLFRTLLHFGPFAIAAPTLGLLWLTKRLPGRDP
jgi:uncharacterized membrane protein YbhN (UPF0104 family)